MRVVVVGGGVAGLASAVQLGRAGHEVTVVERDDSPMPVTADEAFDWDRRGAPQVRHSHAFLARLRNLLLDHQPDILDALLAEGATELRFGDGLAPEIDFTPEPGDDDLVMIACRRTTFEWVLRRAALAEGSVTLRTGHAAVGLVTTNEASPPPPPVVSGVRLGDGADIAADLVVAATGRRSAVAGWLARSVPARSRRPSRTPASSRPVASTGCSPTPTSRRAADRSAATSATSSTAPSSATTGRSRSHWRFRPTTTSSDALSPTPLPSTRQRAHSPQLRHGSTVAPNRSPRAST